MKKADKPILIQAFDKFTEKHNYHLTTTSWSMSYYLAPRLKDTDRTLDYQKEEFLFKDKMNQFAYREKVISFINFLFESPEYEHLAYKFMVEKTPISEARDYADIMREYIKILEVMPEKLYDYITRPAFLKANLHKIEDLFKNHITAQDKREGIVELYMNLDMFKKFSNERIVYNLVQDYIDQKDKYVAYFPNIKPEQQDETSVFAKTSKGEYYITALNVNDLVRLVPERNEYQAKRVIKSMTTLNDFYEKLEVQKIQILEEVDNILPDGSNDGKTLSVIWFAEKINAKLIESFSERFVLESLTMETADKVDTIKYNNWVNSCINAARAELLEEKISHIVSKPSQAPIKKRKL